MVRIYYTFDDLNKKFFRFENKYEKTIDPELQVLNAGFEIFMIMIELKMQFPFVGELLNFSLNIETIFEIHELVKPEYQKQVRKNLNEMGSKIANQAKKSFFENLVTRSSKKMIKEIKHKKAKSELDAGFYEEDDAKNTNRTDNDEVESDVTVIQNKAMERRSGLMLSKS